MRRVAAIVLVGLVVGACTSSASLAPASAVTTAPSRAAAATPAALSATVVPAPTPAVATPQTPGPDATPTEQPVPTAAPPTTVELGSAADVTFANGAAAQVGVVTTERRAACGASTPDAGNAYVIASVGYAATAGTVRYAPSQWLLVQPDGPILIPTTGVTCEKGNLGSGSLSKGHDAGGWIVFQAPAAAKGLRLFFAPGGLKSWVWSVPD
jgi:hypothetical protein